MVSFDLSLEVLSIRKNKSSYELMNPKPNLFGSQTVLLKIVSFLPEEKILVTLNQKLNPTCSNIHIIQIIKSNELLNIINDNQIIIELSFHERFIRSIFYN